MTGRLAAATVPARCIAGLVLLERADAQVLTGGDVVLFPQLRFDGGALAGRTRLVSASFELRGELSASGFTFTHHRTTAPTKENPMSSDDTTLPVEVEIELARVRLPLSELGALTPGHVMALKLDVAGPVTLRVGDQAFARAELVEIEGSVGARIIELL
jgi:type III secretion protein Q